MNAKQIWGLVTSIIGLVLVIIAARVMNIIGNIKGGIGQATGKAHHPVGKMVGEQAQRAVGSYDTLIFIALIVGIFLLALGLWMIFYFYRKK